MICNLMAKTNSYETLWENKSENLKFSFYWLEGSLKKHFYPSMAFFVTAGKLMISSD